MLAEKNKQENKHCPISLPQFNKEYFVLSATSTPYVFELDCFTQSDVQLVAGSISNISEDEYEGAESDEYISERILRNRTDVKAAIVESNRIVKIRRIDRSIIENLKFIYDYRCQITGEKIGERYGGGVVEAHHIDYFTHSQNNVISNLIILSPNYHRIIHRNNPHFNYETKFFEFENG